MPPLLRCKWPALHDPIARRIFLLCADGIEVKITQRTDQPFSFRCVAAVGQIPERRAEIEHIGGQRPAEGEMAGAFGSGGEINKQYFLVGTTWRMLAELVPPQTERPPRAQFARYEADNIRMFAWLRDEFEIVQPDFFEQCEQHCERREWLSRSHGPPTSGRARARCCRAGVLCHGNPT